MMEFVKLLAKVLFGGKVLSGTKCPICGGTKSRNAAACMTCWLARRQEVRQPVLSAVRAADRADEAWERNQQVNAEAAQSDDDTTLVVRRRLSKPVAANLRVGSNAVARIDLNSGLEYLDFQLNVEGGFLSVFVFGAKLDARGKTITGLVEIKSKTRNNIEYRYLRVEVVPGVRSDVDLKVRPYGQTEGFVDGLPSVNEEIEAGEHRRLEGGSLEVVKDYMRFAIGFTAVKPPKPRKEAAADSSSVVVAAE